MRTNTVIVYEYFASTWVFNPAHYAARLEEGKYRDRLEDRYGPWVSFLTEWMPQHYPGYRLPDQDISLDEWRKQTRMAMRDQVFTLFPQITAEYYGKRAAHVKEFGEERLQRLLTEAIPLGREGWSDDMPQPPVVVQSAAPMTPPLKPIVPGQGGTSSLTSGHGAILVIPSDLDFLPPTPPHTPSASVAPNELAVSEIGSTYQDRGSVFSTALHIQSLPREPPISFIAHPPADHMSPTAKLDCIARWTLFDPVTGTPYLSHAPRDRSFSMCWSDSGARDAVLVKWVQNMWWAIWIRQARVNYVGMWRKRFEKEDTKVAKVREEAERVEVAAKRKKILERLAVVNGC